MTQGALQAGQQGQEARVHSQRLKPQQRTRPWAPRAADTPYPPRRALRAQAASTEQIVAEEEQSTNGNGKKNGNGSAAAADVGGVSLLEANGAAAGANGSSALASVLSSAEDLDLGDAARGVEGFMDPCEAGQLDTCAVERIAELDRADAERAAAEAADLAQSAGAGFETRGAAEVASAVTAAAAAAAAAAEAERAASRSAAGTPYANPGGRWSQFKSYSVFQVGDVE